MNSNTPPFDDFVPFGPEWESHMKTLPKAFLIEMIKNEGLKRQTETLSNSETNIIAMALFGLMKKIGPTSIIEIEVLVDKLNIRGQFQYVSDQWDDILRKRQP